MPSARFSPIALAFLLVPAFSAGPAQAATFTVNTLGDAGDVFTTDSLCDSNGELAGEQCTLRAAVEETNALNDSAPEHTINVPAGTYTLTGPALDVTWNLNLVGAGARSTIIEQATADRVFYFQFATVRASGLTFRNGTANASNSFFGGNIRAEGADVTITDSTITGGHASSGGGVSVVGGLMTIRRSTISGNEAVTGGGDGGAIQNTVGRGPGVLTVESSTISGNTARLAGGIISGGSAGNSVTIADTTITGNTSTNRLDLPNGGGLSILGGTATVRRSIVANNSSIAPATPNCASDPQGTIPGTIGSGGFNLESSTDCGFSAAGDKQKANPLLGPLQNNGGQTDTRALLPGSPAFDAAGASCPATDQRGVTRPQGLACDIGAFESIVYPETTIVSGPASFTKDRTPTFTFSSTQPGTTFECSLDGGAFFPCSSPFTPSSELGAGPHVFQVRARTAAGLVDPTPATFFFTIAKTLADLPPPVLGKLVNAEPVSGNVLYAELGGSSSSASGARASQKGLKFIPLREARQIRIGAFFDTRKGRVRLQAATRTKGKTQTGVFYAGLFQTLQSRKKSQKGIFELRLKGSSFKRCGSTKKASTARSKRRIRRLKSNAKGRFRTRGRYSAATVRGTIWDTTDRCDGTLTKVRRGKVAVRDLRRHKTIVLRKGKSYLARAPR